jgi:enoyl-CoA hydratase
VGEGGVVVERAGVRATITLDAPRTRNAVDAAMLERVAAEVVRAGDDPGVRVVVLTGAGGAFSSGADLGAAADTGAPEVGTLDVANAVVHAMQRCPRPVVAAVDGAAAGVGLSLALAADLTVASERSFLMLAFTRIGLLPDGGSTALVAASIGRARALRMALLAERVTARQALEWGLIAEVYPDEGYAAGVDALVERLAAGSVPALVATRSAINAATLPDLPAAMAREREGQLTLLAGADFAEGLAAFRDRRAPRFPS